MTDPMAVVKIWDDGIPTWTAVEVVSDEDAPCAREQETEIWYVNSTIQARMLSLFSSFSFPSN